MKKQVISLNDAKVLLKNSIRSRKNVSIPEIVKIICDYYNISDSFVYNKTRRKDVVKPRQIIMYILREVFDISYPIIGDRLGGRDHTTVIHSYEKIKTGIKNDPELNKEIEEIKNLIN